MNLSIQFYTERLPVAYRMCMLSLIKESLRLGDESVYNQFYSSNQPKPYTFSVFLQDFEIGKSEIYLKGFLLNVSSPEYQFIIPFLNGLQRTKQFRYKDYSIRRGLIQYGRDHIIQSSKIVITTNSPILIEDENGQPLAPASQFYNRHLNRITNQISLSLRGRGLYKEIRIQPVSVKKSVIKETNEDYEQAVAAGKASGEYLFFTTYGGRFVLEGHPEDLQWPLDTGVGLRTSQGLGHIRLESEAVTGNED